jgi:NADPH:quinone reductase-like Zn-dependent oxidoreductase
MTRGNRAWELRDAFGLDHLCLTERDAGEPGRGEVRLSMRAWSLNYRDLLMVTGKYDPKQPLPLVPLSDGVGVVDAAGEGVTRIGVGDRVMPIFAQKWVAGPPTKRDFFSALGGPVPGTLRESMVLSEEAVVKAPAHMSDAEAATLPCAALTAWSALVEHGGLTAGDTVLIQGTGGVSLFALQIAKMCGARAIVTSSSQDKRDRALALGADETIDYRTHADWGRLAKRLSGGEGVDHVVEVGGADTMAESLRAVKPGGQIALIGNLSGNRAEVNLTSILMRNVRVQGIFVGHREGLTRMCRAFGQHEVRPVVDQVFSFEDAPSAFAHLEGRTHFGKIVIASKS